MENKFNTFHLISILDSYKTNTKKFCKFLFFILCVLILNSCENNLENTKTRKKLELTQRIDSLNKTINNNENDTLSYYLRAEFKKELGDYVGAIKDYNQLIKFLPNCEYFYIIRGDNKRDIKDYKGAIKDYNKALNLDTNLSYLNGHILGIYIETGDKNGIEDYNFEIAKNNINSKLEYSLFCKGKAMFILNKNELANEEFTNAILINPVNKDFYYYRGLTRIKLSDKKNACRDFIKAEKLGNKEARKAIEKYCE